MNNEERIKLFRKIYKGKVIRLNEDSMPVSLDIEGNGEERILKYPDCRSALVIMMRNYGALWIHEKEWDPDEELKDFPRDCQFCKSKNSVFCVSDELYHCFACEKTWPKEKP